MYEEKVERVAWRNAIIEFSNRFKDFPNNLQNINTPFDLCFCIITKLKEYVGEELKNLEFCVFNLEFMEVLIYDFGVARNKIWFCTDCKEKAKLCESSRYLGVNIIMKSSESFLKENPSKRFDVIVQNPPFQDGAQEGSQRGTRTHIWQKFISKSISLLKPNGFLLTINPGGWRRPYGKFEDVGRELMEKQIHYLEIHNIQDGQKTFGTKDNKVTTGYDVIVVENTTRYERTTVIDENGVASKIDMSNVKAIPNGQIPEITKLFAKNGEDKVNFITDRSSYGHDKDWVQEEKTEEFKYPVVYSLPQKGEQIWWSSRNDRGHFRVPKIIWSNGAATQIIIDDKGKYGMTEWAYAISDDPKVLPLIKKAMESQKFVNLCKGIKFTFDKYDGKFISLFRSNFWKEFVDEKGNEI